MTSRKLIIHIGMHKTGTSAIQKTCYFNQDMLAKRNYGYFNFASNHSHRIYSLFTSDPLGYYVNISNSLNTDQKVNNFNRETEALIDDYIRSTRFATYIVSGEAVSLLSYADVSKMKHWFDQYFDQYSIIAYVRPPRAYIRSATQQKLKASATISSLSKRGVTPNYEFLFSKFISIFGSENVNIRPFYLPDMYRGDSASDFLYSIDFPRKDINEVSPIRANESVSFVAAKFLNFVNERMPVVAGGKKNNLRSKYMTSSIIRIRGHKFMLPESIYRKSMPDVISESRWLEDNVGINIAQYDSEETLCDASEYSSFANDEIYNLIEVLNNKFLEIEADHLHVMARLAFYQGRIDRAVALCEECLSIAPDHSKAVHLLSRIGGIAMRRNNKAYRLLFSFSGKLMRLYHKLVLKV